MFSYEPLTEEQCQKEKGFSLLEPGVYDFVVDSCSEKISSSNNPMLQLVLKVWDKEGKEHRIFDYLVATKSMMWKLRHFSKCVGLLKEYEEKKLCCELIINKHGKIEVNYIKGKEKPNGGYYPDKNGVEDYILDDKKGNVTKELNDDIPF